ncbi:MAG: putative signaling protein [Anaerolineaceae bacterium]|nr:MAG: putative signaling protein [Anaerolineaceae bacterium]
MSEEQLKNAKILIVDDQESNLAVLEKLLKKQGYGQFKSLTDPRLVIPTFQKWQPDLLLLDLMMPHMDGFAVMQALKPLIPEGGYFPILVLTADIAPEAKRRALSSGAMDFLTKPFDAAEVILRIGNLLNTRSLHLQLQNQNVILEDKVRERTAELREHVDDMALINALNEAVIRGDPFQSIVQLMAQESGRVLNCRGAAIYLLSADGKYLELQSVNLPPALVSKIEKLIGRDLPLARISLKHGSLYRKMLQAGAPQVINDPAAIQQLMAEFTESKALQSFVPAIYSLLGSRSVLAVPLVLKGETIGLLETSRSVPFAESELERFGAIARQLSVTIERLQTKAALQNSEERFRALIENANDLIIVLNPDSSANYVSPSIGRILGFKPDEIAGTGITDFVHPDDLPAALEAIAIRVQTPGLAERASEFRVRHKDGSFRTMEVIGANLLDNPAVNGIVVNARDITERKWAEEQIHRNAARAEALARTAARLNARLDLDAVLDAVCEETRRALDVPVVSVYLHDEQAATLHPARTAGLPEAAAERLPVIPRALYESFASTAESLLIIPDVQAIPNLPGADLYAELGVRAHIAATMFRDHQLIGLLNINTLGQERQFSADELALLKGLAAQAAQAIINARLLAETERRLRNIQSLRAIDQTISGSLDLRLTLSVALEQIVNQLNVDAACVLLLNPYTQTLEYSAGLGFHGKGIEKSRLRLGEGHAGRAALEQCTVSAHELQSNFKDFVRADLLAGEDFDCYHGTPLVTKGQVKGVLEVFLRTHRASDDEWLNFLETLAGQVAIAVDNANLFSNLQHSNVELVMAYDATIEGWSRAMDLRDKETESHTQRVTAITMQMAQAMGIGDEQMVHVRRGALLHDMGKMGIPDAILLEPGALTDDEWVIMRQHPQFAFDMLSPVAYLRPALDIPYGHHEKWDGSGYPRGLKGEQIPLAARIFAVVDVYDALTSDRPYRQAWPEEKAIEHIRAGAGSHFDPGVVEVFLQMADKFPRPAR